LERAEYNAGEGLLGGFLPKGDVSLLA